MLVLRFSHSGIPVEQVRVRSTSVSSDRVFDLRPGRPTYTGGGGCRESVSAITFKDCLRIFTDESTAGEGGSPQRGATFNRRTYRRARRSAGAGLGSWRL